MTQTVEEELKPPRRRRWKLWTIVGVALVVAIASIFFLTRGTSSRSRRGQNGQGVAVQYGSIEKRLDVDGSVQPVATYALAFPVAGSDVVVGPTIKSVNVSVGQHVEKGWNLAQLEGDDVDQAKIFAPVDGVITEIRGAAGAPPPSGATVSMRTLNLQGQFPLSESDLATLKPGAEATATVAVLSKSFPVTITNLPEDPASATTSQTSSQSSSGGGQQSGSSSATSTTTYNLQVPLTNVTGIRPGQTVRLSAVAYSNPHALLIPASAVQGDGASRSIVIVVGQGGPQRRPVTLGVSDGRRVEVLSGLKEGEQVLVQAVRPSQTGQGGPFGGGGGQGGGGQGGGGQGGGGQGGGGQGGGGQGGGGQGGGGRGD